VSSNTTPDIPELSRPRRQFREDQRAGRKSQGRKRKTSQRQLRQTNWQSPFLWSQIEIAAVKAGKPWRPCEILKEARKIDRVVFASLTEQVIGRWIDPEGKHRGLSRWTDAVLERVRSGNSPDGQTTRRGILVR